MSERKQILDMLAAGTITPEEAERLLDKLKSSESGSFETKSYAEGFQSKTNERRTTGTPKFLRVLVNSKNGETVNIRVPLALIRTGIKLGAMLPDEAKIKLNEKGIDLSQFQGLEQDELLEALKTLSIDIDSSNGDVVKVFCE
ncbi:MAG: DUF2089 domain-containing protein [Candidatus Eisenbacteria bacterium]|uniref:DUF2089 domain-containing protein n=1 Tax=Eiseniibacteriota bacterium TaxID=2212470 RepID=A0A948W240_UNCEI|nr:DUF2089 domain-containing protein [Candidatus Eisenbacteria bacterium]MBU1948508.1 DUF2089 domain-containing protein [Candidatus Eisenbacteria bacterium]MBU2689527.1 DUF2089 domain-containing protein [Candidatus Eisenbacteria bacterium]